MIQRSWSLVLCFDACDSWLVLILLLTKNKEIVLPFKTHRLRLEASIAYASVYITLVVPRPVR